MLTFLRPELLEEPAYSEVEYADGVYYFFAETLQHLDVFWNLWNRHTGHTMGMSADGVLDVKRVGVELCHKLELSVDNVRDCYRTVGAHYSLALGALEPCARILTSNGSRANHFMDNRPWAWERDDYRLLWPMDLVVYHAPLGLYYYVDEFMGDMVPALAHWRMSEIGCKDAFPDHIRP